MFLYKIRRASEIPEQNRNYLIIRDGDLLLLSGDSFTENEKH